MCFVVACRLSPPSLVRTMLASFPSKECDSPSSTKITWSISSTRRYKCGGRSVGMSGGRIRDTKITYLLVDGRQGPPRLCGVRCKFGRDDKFYVVSEVVNANVSSIYYGMEVGPPSKDQGHSWLCPVWTDGCHAVYCQ